MATYLIYAQWTEAGIRNIKESPKRLDMGKKKFREMGGEIKGFYLTHGKYDSVAIVDVPADDTLAKYLLQLGSQGNLRTHTVRAYTEEEYQRIVGGLP